MTPVIIVVFLLSVIRIFSSFETELLLGVPWGFYVYATKIVDLARQEPPLVNQAAAFGSVILIFLVAFIPIQRRLIARRQFTTVTGQFKPKIVDLGIWRIPATLFVGFMVFLLDIVPILSVFGGSFMTRFGFFNLPKTWTVEYWKMALSDPRILQGLQNTLIIAFSAAIVGALFFSLVGYVLVRTKFPGRGILDSICWLPSAIPGVLAGLGLLWMFLGTPFFRPFYGTLFLLVIASVLGGITLATQISESELRSVGQRAGRSLAHVRRRVLAHLFQARLSADGANHGVGRGDQVHVRRAAQRQHYSFGDFGNPHLVAFGFGSSRGGLPRGGKHHDHYDHVLTLGVAIVARSFGLKVGIRAD